MTATAIGRATIRYRWLGRNVTLAIGATVLALFVLMALSAPWIAPYDPILQNGDIRLMAPSWATKPSLTAKRLGSVAFAL